MREPGPLRRIVVVGGGSAGWMAAAALARVLGTANVAITLVESEDIGTIGVGEATIPPIALFNSLLDIDEGEFLRRTKGSFKLGIEFVDWRRRGSQYFHPFGLFGPDMGAIPFEALWQRMRLEGRADPLAHYSIAAMAAASGRFMRPAANRNTPLGHISYAYHFDAALYAGYLRELAEGWGVRRVEGRVVKVDVKDGDLVEAVTLASGEAISGDLFLDCSGFRSLLLGQALGVGFEDWSRWLLNDRAVAAPSARHGPLQPFTRSTARSAGWQWRIPLQHRTGNGYVYSSAHLSDDEAIASLLQNLDGDPLAEPQVLRFLPGRRRAMWAGNCVALGLSAGFLEPLESTSIHLIQAGIARLLEMLPDRSFCAANTRRYNRLMIQEFEAVRDFVILHFCATERNDSDYWNYLRTMAPPDSLSERIRIYEATGRVYREADELFTRTSWLAVMEGQGLQARGFDPLAIALPADEGQARLARIAAVTREAARRMPDHGAYLRDQHLLG